MPISEKIIKEFIKEKKDRVERRKKIQEKMKASLVGHLDGVSVDDLIEAAEQEIEEEAIFFIPCYAADFPKSRLLKILREAKRNVVEDILQKHFPRLRFNLFGPNENPGKGTIRKGNIVKIITKGNWHERQEIEKQAKENYDKIAMFLKSHKRGEYYNILEIAQGAKLYLREVCDLIFKLNGEIECGDDIEAVEYNKEFWFRWKLGRR
ncbi:hypothetical protein KAS79_03215 [Candidatus Parcubacteria bacterium]|nr:hypothetical protein [Candidatus Parcubacteria bacterium]